MNKQTRLLLSLGLPILLIIAVFGAYQWQRSASSSLSSSSTGGSTKPLTQVTVALDWTPNTNHTGIYVAQQMNWYRDQGLNVKLLPYSASVNPDVLVSSGKADVGISSTESIVSDAAVGQPVVSLATIIQHNTSALVTLASSGLNRPRDLDGKVYAGFGAPYEGPVVSQIIKHDGGKGQFRNVTLNGDAVQALESHRADFAWVFMGWEGIQAERDGSKLNAFMITDNGIPDYYTPNIITSPNEMKQQPELLRRFMAATAKGYEYARTHPDQAAQLLLNGAKGAFPDPGLVLASQRYLSPRYVDSGRKWGLQDAAAWHGYPDFMLKNGGVQDASGKTVTSLNLDALFTNQFLP